MRLWEAASGRLLRTLQGHKGAVYSVAYSPDGHTLASASDDDTVRLWEVASGRLLRTLQGHNGTVYCVAYSPDGRTLASASDDDTVRLWEAASGRLLRTLQGHNGTVYSVAYSPDGRTLASASSDGTVRLWGTASGRFLRTVQGHNGAVNSVAYSPDGRTLASASSDGTLHLRDALTGTLLRIVTTPGPNWLLIDTGQRRFWRGDDSTFLTRLPSNDAGAPQADPVLPPRPTPPAQLTATLLTLDPPGEGADAAGRVVVRVHNARGAGPAYWLRLDADYLPPGLVLVPENQRMRLDPDGTVELQATLSYLSGTGPRRTTAPEPGPHPLQTTLHLIVREAFQNITLPPRPLDIHAPQLTVTEPTSALGLRQSAVQVQLINSGNQPSGALTVTARLQHAGTAIGEPVQQQYTPLPPGQSHTLSLPLPAGLPRFARYQLQVEIHGDIWPTHVWQHTVPVRLWLGLVLIAGLFVTLATGTAAFLLIRPHLDPIVRRVTREPAALRTISLPDLPQTERVLCRARRFDTARQAAGISSTVWQRLLHATGQPASAARVLAEAIGAKLGAPIDVADVPGASAWHLTLPTLHIRFGPATALVLLDGPECERGPARRLAELIDDHGRGPQQVLVLDRTTTQQAAAALDGLHIVFVTLTLPQLRDLHLAEDPAQALTATIVAARPARELSPYHLGHGVEEERQFFGRRAELRRIADGAPHNVLLFGPRQMGKTALLWALERRLAARGDVAFRRVDIGGDEAFKACHGDVSALWRLLARKLELSDSPLTDVDGLLARLAGTRAQPRWWLLDEVDAFLTADRAHGYALGHRLRGLAAEGRAYFVLAGWSALHEAATRERSSPLRNLGELLHLGPLTTEEAREMLQRPLTTLNFRLQDALADQIIHETGRRPNLLARVGDALIQQALVDEREIPAGRVEAVLHSSELLGQELNYWRKEPLAEPLVYAALQGEPPTRAELFDRLEQHGYDGNWQLAAESLDRLDVDYVLVPGPDGRLVMPVPLLEHHIRAQGPLDVMIRRTLRIKPKDTNPL